MTTELALWVFVGLAEFLYFVSFFSSFVITLIIAGVYNMVLAPRLGLTPLTLLEAGLLVMLFDFAASHWTAAFSKQGITSTIDSIKGLESMSRKA